MRFNIFYYIDTLRYAMSNGKVYYQGADEDPECNGDWELSCCTQRDIYRMADDGTVTAVRNY